MTESSAADGGATAAQTLIRTLAALDAQDPRAQQATRELLRWLHARLAALGAPSANAEESGAQRGDAADDVWASAAPSSIASGAASGSAEGKAPRVVDAAGAEEIYAEVCKLLPQWLAPAHTSPVPLALWLQWMEIASCAHAFQCITVSNATAGNGTPPPERIAALMRNAKAPVGFSAASAHCDAQQQLAFSCGLWDAIVSSPARSAQATSAAQESLVREHAWSQRLDVFVHWMTQAMRGYDVVFLNNVGTSLIAHIQNALPHTSSQLNVHANVAAQQLQTLIGAKSADNQWQKHASSIAIVVLVQHALPNARRDGEAASVSEVLSDLIVSKLKMDAFPHAHDPHTIVGVALDIASTTAPNGSTWASVLVQQFALLRRVNLSLASFRLDANEQHAQRLVSLRKAFQDNLARVVHADYDAGMVALSFQMTEACVVEALGFFRHSAASYMSLLHALQSVYAPELFRDVLVKYAAGSTTSSNDGTSKADTHALLEYLKTLYDTVASTLQVLTETQRENHSAALLAFLTLSKLEFARETCSLRERNAFMITLTQRLEVAIEAMPEPVLSRLFRSVSNRDVLAAWSSSETSCSNGDSSIPQELDIILSCQVLVVGLIMQRKLRVLLFQPSALMDEAIALVFTGLYNGYEPLDAFAHRFLGFCLTHLGQYISINDIVPHYLQVALDKYPENASQDTIARTCGVIFGALYYASSLAPSAEGGSAFSFSRSVPAGLNSQQRMVLWALKKCCNRVAELLLVPEAAISPNKASDPADSVQDSEQPQDVVVAAKSEPNTTTKSGLYLSGIVFELLKMGPLELLAQMAMEIELLLSACTAKKEALDALKEQLLTSISQHCDAEKRAWLAAWYVELAALYRSEEDVNEDTAEPHARL